MKKLFVLSALAAFAVACGGSDTKPADPSTTTSTTAPADTSKGATPAAPASGTAAPASTDAKPGDAPKK